MTLAKLKTLLRTAAERTIGALYDRIGIVLDAYTPQECSNYFKHAGQVLNTLAMKSNREPNRTA